MSNPKFLVVVDMQNDFITGPLGTPEARAIVPRVKEVIASEDWDRIFYLEDTHSNSYLGTQEGRKLPVKHCMMYTEGWQVPRDIKFAHPNVEPTSIMKFGFGSKYLLNEIDDEPYAEIALIGLCTDICVITNALMIKGTYPEMTVRVVADACAGTTPEMHQKALDVMRSCQIEVV